MSDPLIPVSWGELFDRISILEIKTARLNLPEAQADAGRQLAKLRAIGDDKTADGLAVLRDALKTVNERLWEIEDAIRARDARDLFDDVFVELARNVYRTNDERNRLKRAIDALLGSEIVELKQYTPYEERGAV